MNTTRCVRRAVSFVVTVPALAGATALAQPSTPAAPPKSAAVFPNPLITEVLFDVPGGVAGDANGDTKRSATGDEFIELINPHDRPINLKGYMLTDAAGWPVKTRPNPASPKTSEAGEEPAGHAPPAAPAKAPKHKPSPGTSRPAADAPAATEDAAGGKARRGSVRFVFPEFVLQPGERVVVFNGHKQVFTGAIGDSTRAPASTNPAFAGAFVFSMKIDSPFSAFSNTGDWAALADPAGKPVEVAWWGVPDFLPPEGVAAQEVPTGKESAARATLEGPLMPHSMLPGVMGSKKFSPGAFSESDLATPPDAAPAKPDSPKPPR